MSERPFRVGRWHTAELPATPTRDYSIAATSWIEAPPELLSLGEALGEPVAYKRRLGRFLLWRAGPAVGEARYLAIAADNGECFRFDLHGKTGRGVGPGGSIHTRFRTWKESLLERTA